jgi:hypothetical protein
MRKIPAFTLSLLAFALPAHAAENAPTWDIILQIEGLPTPPPKVDYLEIDGFESTKEQVDAIKAQGTKAICYISAGTAEDFRPDFAEFKKIPNTIGNAYPNFEGDYFINTNHWRDFFPVMKKRIQMCKDKGFDYVDFDVIDSYDVDPEEMGFRLSQETQTDYITALTKAAHESELKTVQKNATELAAKLEPHFDALLTEECVRLDFCGDAEPYVAAGKPVFNVEYPESWKDKPFSRESVCDVSDKTKVRTILSTLALDGPATDACP